MQMARSVKNWCYRAYSPSAMKEKVDEQMKLAARYRNDLCRIELERRADVEAVLQSLAKEYIEARNACEAVETAIEGVYERIKDRSKQARKKIPATIEDKQDIAVMKSSLKLARTETRALKAETFARADIRAALDATGETSKAKVRAARAASGLYWGNYLIVEDAAKTFGKGAPPRFERWDGCGKVV